MFCTTCGKAVSAGGGGPRIVEDAAVASTDAGVALQTQLLENQTRKAFGCLLAVAVLQFLAAGFFFLRALDTRNTAATTISVATGIIGMIFLGLAFWARRNPLPAAITGLVLLVTLYTIDAVAAPSTIYQGIIVKVIIVTVLANAVRAGVRHKRLLHETAGRAG